MLNTIQEIQCRFDKNKEQNAAAKHKLAGALDMVTYPRYKFDVMSNSEKMTKFNLTIDVHISMLRANINDHHNNRFNDPEDLQDNIKALKQLLEFKKLLQK